MTKYSGANWLKFKSMCPLAIKVANLLGQVYEGIYHLDSSLHQLEKLKSPDLEYTIGLFGSMATYDYDTLTRLLLCSQAAGLDCTIKGSRKGSIRLVFREGKYIKPYIGLIPEVVDFESLADAECEEWRSMTGNAKRVGISRKSSFLSVCWDANGVIYGFGRKSGEIPMERLVQIVAYAHSACVRAEISGRCGTGYGQIGILWTARSRTATTIMEGHPTTDRSKELKSFWDIDYATT
jgi:hypothetical protein